MKTVTETLKQSSVVLGAIGIMVSFSSPAEARPGGSSSSVTCDLGNFSGSSACLGPLSGNDSNSDLSGSFGIDTWTEFSKLDAGSGNNGKIDVVGSSTSGNWSLNGLDSSTNYMVALKGDPSHSLYYLGSGNTGFNNETWNTDGIVKGNGKANPGLSHFSVYQGSSEAVPEPMTILGVALAGGLGAWGKKKLGK